MEAFSLQKTHSAMRLRFGSGARLAHDPVRGCLERMVSAAFHVDDQQLRCPGRGPARVARARQVAMYLAHTVCGLSFTDVGEMFERDRTTVSHACSVVEEAREDRQFDRALDMLERSTRILVLRAMDTRLGETRGRRCR